MSWHSCIYQQKLGKSLNTDPTISHITQQAVLYIIYDDWDSIYGIGTERPMLSFKLCIDTDYYKAVCYRRPTYCVHGSKMMTECISPLENNG